MRFDEGGSLVVTEKPCPSSDKYVGLARKQIKTIVYTNIYFYIMRSNDQKIQEVYFSLI